MLDLRVRHRLGSFTLDAALEAPAAAVTVVVGESGAGKSTLLRLVAGLRAPDSGTIRLGRRVLCDRATGAWVPPERRPVGFVAQDYALFPHLSALDNVAFGLRASGRSRRAARAAAAAMLARFGIAALAGRRPAQLSGGQQQRVALARALVLDPEVLLLDEPLAALDVATRREVRAELRRTLAGLRCVTLLVTHQPAEALAFGDHVVVLEGGAITQAGTRDEFVRRPRSRYVAEFLGVNLFEGTIRGAEGGLLRVAVGGGELAVPGERASGAVRLLLHPHTIVLSDAAPAGSAVNVLRGPVEEVVPEPPAGERVRVRLATSPPMTAELTRHSAEAMGLAPGRIVHASFKASAVEVLEG